MRPTAILLPAATSHWQWIQNTVRDNAKPRMIGVVDDFNFQSLKQTFEPLVILPGMDRGVALIKSNGGNIQAGIKAVGKAYKKTSISYTFEYNFLDEQVNEMYRKDIWQQTILCLSCSLYFLRVLDCLVFFI
jgi:putative ABC transport system permease protein